MRTFTPLGLVLAAVVAFGCVGTTAASADDTPASSIPPTPLCYTVTLDSPTTGTDPTVTVCRP